jgi:hypothetical protein
VNSRGFIDRSRRNSISTMPQGDEEQLGEEALLGTDIELEASENDMNVWEVFSYCDSFVISTELSDKNGEIGKDDCVSTVTLVLHTASPTQIPQSENHQDPLKILLPCLNSTVACRLCSISSVYVFPSILSHIYFLLRQQLRTTLHCYELLQQCNSVDRSESLTDITNSSTLMKYVTTCLVDLIMTENTQGKSSFSLGTSSALVRYFPFLQ